MFEFDSVSCIDLFGNVEKQREKQIEVRAVKRRHRINSHRAASTSALATVLGKPEIGESYHVISHGDIDSLSFLEHILKFYSLDYVLMSTWCMAAEDVAQIESWLRDGKIKRIDAYCGEIFPNQYANIHADLCRVVKPGGGRVCIFRNHSKIFAGIGANVAFAIESSANVNTNPRTEQSAIHMDAALFHFYKDFYDGVKSFIRNFDTWTPYTCNPDAPLSQQI